ncbi:MAG: prolyl oligopeptidase family serine peptidase [Verrucomicrobiae bacterium]|nr:prolyl oligopeptidase family serine peptidase [Verrucomicrobiae bacterium]
MKHPPVFALCFFTILTAGAADALLPDNLAALFRPPAEYAGDFGDFRSPLTFEDGSEVKNPADWTRRREEIRSRWTRRLGEWPPVIERPEVEILATEDRGTFTQHTVRFLWTPKEKTTGYLLIPEGASATDRRAAVVTVYYEPETAIGRGNELRDFAYQLTKRGFVTLSIGTKEASEAKTYALYWPSMENVGVQPLSMLGYAAANAFHVLANRPEVDEERIGITGHSFGGKWSMFASCLYDKFACAAWSDPGIVFDDTRPSINYWEPWYLGWHPQPWRKRGMASPDNPIRGLYPELRKEGLDLHELHALMAPRPFFVSGGSEDTPARWKALNHSIAVNRVLGSENRVGMHNRPAHPPTPESNEAIYAFFAHFLRQTAP